MPEPEMLNPNPLSQEPPWGYAGLSLDQNDEQIRENEVKLRNLKAVH